MASLKLRLPNRLSSVETARLALQEHLKPHALSPKTLYRLELVLEEALMNRVWHAWPQGGEHGIELELRVESDAVVLVLEDDGVAFDPTAAPTRPAPSSLAEARPGGLGLELSRKAVRSMRYERIGDRNHWQVDIARD